MTDIRALTIRQPWASAIAHFTKRVENRTRQTRYRGRVLIHAGKQPDNDAWFQPPNFLLMYGAIIATADLVDCHRDNGCCRPWGEPGTWHWRLTNVHALPEPISCRGALGLWHPTTDVLNHTHETTSK